MPFAPPRDPLAEITSSSGFPASGQAISAAVRASPRTVPDAMAYYFLDWLPELQKLAVDDSLEEALDLLFERVDGWLQDGNFQACEELLKVPVHLLHPKVALGILALTKPAASKLAHRNQFFHEVRQHLSQRADVTRTLLGLE